MTPSDDQPVDQPVEQPVEQVEQVVPTGAAGASGGAGARSVRGSAHVFDRDSVEFNRMVNLTDAVVAIALTILVLQLAVPAATGNDEYADIGAVLRGLESPALAFFLSFVIIAFSWFGHQRFVERLVGFDGVLIVWNFAYLLALVLVPFASDLVGNYGDSGSALSVYAVLMAALFGLDFPGRVLASRRRLLVTGYTTRQWWAYGALTLTTPVVFLLSIPILLSTGVGAWIWVVIWPITAAFGRVARRADAEAAAMAAPAA